MFLTIDIGNTGVKAGIFENEAIIEIIRFDIQDFSIILKEIAQKYTVKKAIISSVGKLSSTDQEVMQTLFDTLVLNTDMLLAFDNKYLTPTTLGVDRIALTAAAVTNFPNQNVLIIDAGTCVTYDFVTKKAAYLGGAIAPGLQSRYKALHDYTANLPLLSKDKPINYIGNTAETSIHSGVCNGMAREIDGVISQYRVDYETLTIVLTGGDADFLAGLLKSSIFVRPFFLLEGLFSILKLNK